MLDKDVYSINKMHFYEPIVGAKAIISDFINTAGLAYP